MDSINTDLFQGQGTLTCANGDVISGPFVRGKPHGKCLIKYHNGDVYEGGMQRGLYSGYPLRSLTRDGSSI